MVPVRSFLASVRTLAAALGLAALFLAFLVRFFLPGLTVSVYGLLILSLIFFILAALGAAGHIRESLFSRRTRYWLNTLTMVALFIAVMVLANYLGATRHRRFDLTASGRFTLAPQTVKVLEGLASTVEAVCFFPDDPEYRAARVRARDLLEEYRFFSRKFSFRFVDPEARPALARRYRIRQSGTIVFESGLRQKAVQRLDEQSFTQAILEATGKKAREIYFLRGHGERDPGDKGPQGYDLARRGLVRDLYRVKTLDLTSVHRVPKGCAVLVAAGPRKPFSPGHIRVIRACLKEGGKLLLLADPDPPSGLDQILADWGLTIAPGRIIDRGSYAVPDLASPAVFRGRYPPVIITAGLDTTYFPEAAALVLTKELARVLQKEGEDRGAPRGWPLDAVQYRDLAILPGVLSTSVSRIEAEGGLAEKRGPFALAALVIAGGPLAGEVSYRTKEEGLTRLVIIGDSDFAANAHIQNGGNGDLFLNAVNWLAEDEDLIAIRPKTYSFRRLLVSRNGLRFIRYSSVGLLPLLALIAGGVIWRRKDR